MPVNAGSQIITIVKNQNALSPWTGLGVFCLYGALAIALATAMITRRDA